MYDSERDSFMVALKALGYSMNTTKEREINEAYQWLLEQREEMNPVYVGDESIDTMISGVKAMAIMSGLMDLLFRKSASKQNLQMNLLII